MSESRIRHVRFSPDLVVAVLTTGHSDHFRVEDGLPSGAQVLGIFYDGSRHEYVVTVHHESFEALENGKPIPLHRPMFSKIYCK